MRREERLERKVVFDFAFEIQRRDSMAAMDMGDIMHPNFSHALELMISLQKIEFGSGKAGTFWFTI